MRFIFLLAVAGLYLAHFAPVAIAQNASTAKTKTIMVLDASGSMWGQIEGKNKITIAREVISGLAQTWQSEDHLGLMAYGHRVKGDCGDIETLIPVGPMEAGSFVSTVQSINPKGKTPLSESIRRAARELRFEEDPATVILVTDGIETCDADPCSVAAELEAAGVHFTAHVVAFDLSQEEQASLACIADNTGGQILSASNAGQLQAALGEVAQASAVEPSGIRLSTVMVEGGKPITEDFLYYTIFDAAGNEVKGTNENQPQIYLPTGDYTVKVRHNITTVEDTFSVAETGTSDHIVVIGTGYLKVSAKENEESDILTSGPTYHVFGVKEDGSLGENVDFNNNPTHTFALARGQYKVRANLGPAVQVFADAEIQADETTELVINLNTGTLDVSSTAGGQVADGTYWYIYHVGADGKPAGSDIAFNNNTTTSFKLAEGEYVVRARNDSLGINKYALAKVIGGQAQSFVVPLDE